MKELPMEKIDLHGIRHDMVRKKVIRAIEDHWMTGDTLDLITGHSNEMKGIVIEVLEEYGLEYRIGDFSQTNMGFIRTTVD